MEKRSKRRSAGYNLKSKRRDNLCKSQSTGLEKGNSTNVGPRGGISWRKSAIIAKERENVRRNAVLPEADALDRKRMNDRGRGADDGEIGRNEKVLDVKSTVPGWGMQNWDGTEIPGKIYDVARTEEDEEREDAAPRFVS